MIIIHRGDDRRATAISNYARSRSTDYGRTRVLDLRATVSADTIYHSLVYGKLTLNGRSLLSLSCLSRLSRDRSLGFLNSLRFFFLLSREGRKEEEEGRARNVRQRKIILWGDGTTRRWRKDAADACESGCVIIVDAALRLPRE